MSAKQDRKRDLEILGLAGIFQGIAENSRTGILNVQSGTQEKHIYFLNGNIKLIASTHRSSIIAEGIRRSFGKVDIEVVEEAFRLQTETGKNLAEILLELGFKPEFIESICRIQIKEELFEIFVWIDTQFEFVENATPETFFSKELLTLNLSINPSIVFMEMAGRLDEWKVISEQFPSLKDIPYVFLDVYEDQVTPEQYHLLSLSDGTRDFEEILTQSRLSYFQTMQQFFILFTEKQCLSLRTALELKEMAQWDEYRGNITKCIKLYERVEELGIQDISTISWLAEAYESSGLISKAISKYKQLGELCSKQHDFDGAIHAYDRVITYAPEDFTAHKNYIQTLFESNKFEDGSEASIVYARKLAGDDKRKAIQVLENAYQHNPINPNVIEYMARLYWELNEHNDAIFNYTTLANVYKTRKMYQESIQTYQSILAIDHKNVQARIELANTYLLMGESAHSVEEYKKLGDILRVTSLNDSFAFNSLITVCEKIIEFEPENIQAREWLADIYIYRQDFEKAKRLLNELLGFLANKNYPDTLISVLQKLVQIDPKNRSHHRFLAQTHHRLAHYDEATKELICVANLAIEEGTQLLREQNTQASYSILGESLEALNLVLIIEPFNLEVRQKRAELLHQLGHTQDAVNEYKLVWHMTKAIHNNYDALTALFHLIELAPDAEPDSFLEMAKMCERQNQIDLALTFYKKYARRSLVRGDFGETISTCKRLLQMVPNDNEVATWRDAATQMAKS